MGFRLISGTVSILSIGFLCSTLSIVFDQNTLEPSTPTIEIEGNNFEGEQITPVFPENDQSVESRGKVVYFLSGHGEASISIIDGKSMSQLVSALETRSYTVSEVSLFSSSTMPEDASLLVVAGPQMPLSEDELELIDEFLQGGGAAIFMEDPTIYLDAIDSENDSLAEYLTDIWGITLVNDLVLDFGQGNQNHTITFAYGVSQHPVVDSLNAVPAFPIARSVNVTGELAGVSQKPVIFSDPDTAYGETDFEALLDGTVPISWEYPELVGPALMVVAENFETGARIVVVGDSDFARDDNFSFQSNGELIINAIDWAIE